MQEEGSELSKISVGYSFQQPGADTYLIGMNKQTVLYKNMDLLKGLSENDEIILKKLKEK